MDVLDDVEDWRLVVLARPGGFDEYVLLDDGPVLVASVRSASTASINTTALR